MRYYITLVTLILGTSGFLTGQNLARAENIFDKLQKESGNFQGALNQAMGVPSIVGTWSGTYRCAQGPYGMRFTIDGKNPNNLQAVINFFPLKARAGGSGSYEGRATFDNRTNTLVITPVRWIKQTQGFFMVGLNGALHKKNNSIAGKMAHPSCGEFSVNRGSLTIEQVATAAQIPAQNPDASRQSATPVQSNTATAGLSESKGVSAAPIKKSQTSHAPVRDVDIVGLRIGMSVDKATSALKARQPNGHLRMVEETFEGLPPVRVFYGLEGKNWVDGTKQPVIETILVAFTGPPVSPFVFAISRQETYMNQSKQPNRQVLLQALADKYGPRDYNLNDTYKWYLDNTVWSGPVQRGSSCTGHFGLLGKRNILHANASQSPNVSCGRILEVSIYPTSHNANLVQSLTVTMHDYRLHVTGLDQAREQVAASANRLRVEEAKKASFNKPSL